MGEGGVLSLSARFKLDVVGVDPLQVISDVSDALSTTLQDLGSDFEGVVVPFVSGFDSGADSLAKIGEKVDLELDATVDFCVNIDLSLSEIVVESLLRS